MIKDKLAKVEKIIVHPGRAHLDDFLSIALATQFVKVRHGDRVVLVIERKVPTREELADDQILIFDIGEKNDPEQLNFDHHKLEGPTSSFQLFLEALGLWEEFKVVHPWAERASYMDHRGPNDWAEANGVNPRLMCSLVSPVEDAIIAMFMDNPDNYIMLEVFERVGRYCISMIEEVNKCIKEIEDNHEILITPRGVLAMKYEGEIKLRIFPAASGALARKYGWSVSITPDDRGDGWSIYRFSSKSGINFKLIENEPNVVFTHRQGFLAKVKKDANIATLIDLSIE